MEGVSTIFIVPVFPIKSVMGSAQIDTLGVGRDNWDVKQLFSSVLCVCFFKTVACCIMGEVTNITLANQMVCMLIRCYGVKVKLKT